MANFILNTFATEGDGEVGGCCEGCGDVDLTTCGCGCTYPTLCWCYGDISAIPYAVTVNGIDTGRPAPRPILGPTYVYVFVGDENNCYYKQCNGGFDDATQLTFNPDTISWTVSVDGIDYYTRGDCDPLGTYAADEEPEGSWPAVLVRKHTLCEEDFPLTCMQCPESC